MGLEIVNRKYFTRWSASSNSFLFGNSAQRITERIDIVVDFDFTSSVAQQVIIDSPDTIKLNGGDWGGLGFIIGDTVSLAFDATNSNGVNESATAASRTIANIDGDLMQFTADIFISEEFVGIAFPTQSIASVMEIKNSTRFAPEEIDFYHNLQINDQGQSDFSVIDGEVNRFVSDIVSLFGIGSVANMLQLGNKSGGTYDDVTIERLADSGAKAQYRIELDYLMPDIQDGDFETPDWFDSDNCLKSTGKILCYPEINNPNSELSASYDNRLGNTGWYDEEHNQGVNEFESSVTLTGASGTILNELDHNQTCEIEAVITSDSNFDDQVEAKISIIPQIDEFKNNEFKHAQNTYTSTFYKDGVSAAILDSYIKESREITTSGHSVDVSVANQITVSFNFVPNSEFTNYINALAESDRRYRIVCSVQKSGGSANNNNNVSLILKQGLFQKEPLPDVEFDGVVSKEFFNHSQDLDSGLGVTILNGCTEDDFMYKAKINLKKDTSYLALRGDIEVVRDSDGANFSLLSKTLPLDGFLVSNDGTQNINYNEQLNQFLDSAGRNLFAVQNTGNSTGTTYEVQILWSLLASWRYWLENNNAFSDFIDIDVPNNGLNYEWMRYLREAGYKIRLIMRLQVEDQNFFFENEIQLQDYEENLDTPEINTDIVYIDQNGDIQSALLENQLMTVRANHTLVSGVWDENNIWGWISQRPFENEPNKRISTRWDWTSQNSPLKPKTGLTKAELTFPTTDVARIEALVDTSLIDVENISFISRIQSPSVDEENIPFNPFIFKVDTEIFGETGMEKFKLPMNGLGFNAIVDWGDGTTEAITSSTDIIHEYPNTKQFVFIIKIYYEFPWMYFKPTGDSVKVIDIIQWGDVVWGSHENAFINTSNLSLITATDAPDLSICEDLAGMFNNSSFNSEIDFWNTTNINNFSAWFLSNTDFNKPLGSLNVTNMINGSSIFDGASSFNQLLSGWNFTDVLDSLSRIFKNSGMSTANYTDTIVGWANKAFINTSPPINVNMSDQAGMTYTNSRAGGANFATAGDARTYLTGTLGWTISGDTVI